MSDGTEEPRDLEVEIRGKDVYLHIHPPGTMSDREKILVGQTALLETIRNGVGELEGVSPTRRNPKTCGIERRTEGLLIKIHPASQISGWWVIVNCAEFESAVRETNTSAQSTKRQPNEIHLQWHGPYSIVDGTGLPNLLKTDDEAAKHPGVYFWSFLVEGVDFVHYIGKAERTLKVRAKEEFKPKHPNRSWIPDIAKLQLGIREWVYAPKNVRIPDEDAWLVNPTHFENCWKQYLQLLRVYIAPMPAHRSQIRDVETSLMYTVWDHEGAYWGTKRDDDYYFLSNGTPIPKPLAKPLSIRMTTLSPIRGIS